MKAREKGFFLPPSTFFSRKKGGRRRRERCGRIEGDFVSFLAQNPGMCGVWAGAVFMASKKVWERAVCRVPASLFFLSPENDMMLCEKKRRKQGENSSTSAFESRNFLLKDFPGFVDDDKEAVNRAIFQINSFHCRQFPFPFFFGINYQPTPLFSDFHIKRTPELALKQENFKIARSSFAINENFPLRRIPRLPSQDCGYSFRIPLNFQKNNYLFLKFKF